MGQKIEVSIICNTYNQEKYIRKAMESFLSQKTSFDFEILIHDDASSDNTRGIIEEYATKYPDIVKAILQSENQWRKSVDFTYEYQYPRVKGKYIAFCEGDDYWIDDSKLQKQYDILESNPLIDMCAHRAIVVYGNDEEVIGYLGPFSEDVILSPEKVIEGGGGYLATNSLFYRKEIIEKKDKFIEVFDIDYALQMRGAIRGGIYYLGDCMSAYRRQAEGSWTTMMRNDLSKKADFYKREVEMLKQFNVDTDKHFKNSVHKEIVINSFKALVFKILSLKEKLGKNERRGYKK